MAQGNYKGLGIDFDFSSMRGQIDERGENVIHEIGLRCTCNREDMFAGETEHGAHAARQRRRFGCTICSGYGYIYRQARYLTAMITGIRQSKTQVESGWIVPGDATMSVMPGELVSAGDLITFTWSEPISDGQTITRGAAAMGDNQSRKTGLEDDEDRLWYNAESSIYCEDEDGNVYSSGSNFVLNGSKIIKWAGGPAKGKSYTIKYNAYHEWVVFVPPDIRRDHGRDLGTRVAIRKRHVAMINTSAAASAADKIPFCNRLSC